MEQNQPAGAGTPADDTFMADLLAEGDTGTPQPEPQQAVEEPQPEAPRAPATREPERIPLAEYLAERQRRQRYERRVQELEAAEKKNKPEIPEFWVDPNAATDFRVRSALDPVTQRVQEMTLAYSRRFATQEHGAETVQAAIQSLATLRQDNPAEFHRLDQTASNSMDPVGDVVRWHKQQSTLREIGPDPAAYRKKLEDELLASPEFHARMDAARGVANGRSDPPRASDGTFQAQPQRRMPLPNIRGAGSSGTVATGQLNEQSDEDLLNDIMAGT